MSFLLAWNTWLVGGLTVLFLVVCVMMILTVLIQRPQGGGLSGAFGSGAGSGQTAFGAKTGDALTIFTIIVFVLFLGFGISLNYGYRPSKPDQTAPQVLKTSVTTGDGKTTTQEGGAGVETTPDGKTVIPIPVPETGDPNAPASTPAEGAKTEPPAEAPAAEPTTAPATPPATPPASAPK